MTINLNHRTAYTADDWFGLILGILVSLLSYWISLLYLSGDQEAYIRVYSLVSGIGLGDARFIYEENIAGSEYFHFIFIWLASTLELDKNVVMGIANGFLAAYAWQLFCNWGADRRIATFIVLSNFYMLVLYFAAERLKFGMLFCFISLLAMQNYKRRIFFAALALETHLTVLFVGWGFWIEKNTLVVLRGLLSRNRVFLPMLLFIFVFLMLLEYKIILGKFITYFHYSPELNIRNIAPAFLLFFGAVYYAKQLGDPLHKMGLILLLILILGGSRLNMLLYFVFLYYALRCKAGWNVGVLSTTLYLSWKSVLFVQNIFLYGSGFI